MDLQQQSSEQNQKLQPVSNAIRNNLA